jgi:hypothetical protein
MFLHNGTEVSIPSDHQEAPFLLRSETRSMLDRAGRCQLLQSDQYGNLRCAFC